MIELKDTSSEEIDVIEEIKVNYSYSKHPKRGYQCAYTEGMDKYGSPELCLMDYYNPYDAEYFLFNMADCVLNGGIFDPELDDYDFFSIVRLQDDDGGSYDFGFIAGELYGHEVMCMQLLDEDENPIHPGQDFLPSYTKRGFEPWPLYRLLDEEDEDCYNDEYEEDDE